MPDFLLGVLLVLTGLCLSGFCYWLGYRMGIPEGQRQEAEAINIALAEANRKIMERNNELFKSEILPEKEMGHVFRQNM